MLGGEQSGHIIYLDDHVTGDGLAAALLLCGALDGRTLAEAAAVMPRFPQVKENVRVDARELLAGARSTEVERLERRARGTRPRPRPAVRHRAGRRVLAEAETEEEAAAALC